MPSTDTLPDGWRPPAGLGWEQVPRKLWPEVYQLLTHGMDGSVEVRDAIRKVKDWKREHDADLKRRKVKKRRRNEKAARRRNRSR